jgi:hypothetical protein
MRLHPLLLLLTLSAAAQPPRHPIYPHPAFYPRAANLPDHSLFITFDHPTPTGRAIASLRSTDAGRSFNHYGLIAHDDSPRVDLANAFPLQLPDGPLLVAYRHHLPTQNRYQILLAASNDAGETFKPLSTIATGTTGLWEPFLLVAPNNELHCYYASEEDIYPDQRIELRISRDAGQSWSPPITVVRKPGSRDGMPAVVKLPDNTLLLCFEASDTPPFRFVIRTVRSHDNGRSWSRSRSLVYQPTNTTSSRWAAGAPHLLLHPAGHLLLTFQTDEDVTFHGNTPHADPAHSAYRYERHTTLKLTTSKDTLTWSAPTPHTGSSTNPTTWSALHLLPNHQILMLTTQARQIYCQPLPSAEP